MVILLNMLCSCKSSLISKNIPKCFYVIDWILLIDRILMILLIVVWIKTHFSYRKAHLLILFKSLFKFFADKSLLYIIEKGDVSWANSLGFESKLSGKSFIYITKNVIQQLYLEEPLLQHWPILNVYHLELLFAFYILENLSKCLVS